MKLFSISFGLVLLVLFNLFASPVFVRAQEVDDDSNEDAVIDDETPTEEPAAAQETETEVEDEDKQLSSPFVSTNILFVSPETLDFPAGKTVRIVVGFHNNGSTGFIVDSIDASLRYPQDFSYHIQNFTAFGYGKVVEPEKEATFEYAFTPSETFSSRPFGLVISLNYRNTEGKVFINGLFNDTINVVEPDEGFDGETFFLYIFLIAIAVLLVVIGQQFFSTSLKKRITSKISNVQKTNGTTNSNDVDFEWIPKEHLQTNKSPRQSPRQRNTARQTSSGGSASENEN